MADDTEIDIEISVKDIVNFYIKINDSSKAKREIAGLSAKDKALALEMIAYSSASRDFRIDVARYFIYDLDAVVRRKSERFMEELVPDWVTNPADRILKLLKSTGIKETADRNTAVKYLFGIVDASGLRDAFTTLLNSRNRDHLAEIMAIIEKYIAVSNNEREQVKIFDACLDIVVQDDVDNAIRHYASNLLSVFFTKVQSTTLGETLRRKFIEKQVNKAEGIYHSLCSGAFELNNMFLDDLLKPLKDGGSSYQVKILTYFRTVLEKAKNPEEADSVLDTYPDYWNQDEPAKEEKIRAVCSRILRAADELWDATEDKQVRALIIQIRFGEYADKRELLEQIRLRLEDPELAAPSREKIAMMLRCFLLHRQPDALKMQVSRLLLFKVGDPASRLAVLDYLASYLENRDPDYAEQKSIAMLMESLLAETYLGEALREKARYLLFLADPKGVAGEREQNYLLGYLRSIVEGKGFDTKIAEKRVLAALAVFLDMPPSGEKVKKTAQYLAFRIQFPKEPCRPEFDIS